MVTKIKEFKGTRDVLYEKVLDHSLNLALRTGLTAISFKYIDISITISELSLVKQMNRAVKVLITTVNAVSRFINHHITTCQPFHVLTKPIKS